MIKFLTGLALTILGVFILIILTFAYRDFNVPLMAMFLIALLVYPYGIYLMIKNRKGSEAIGPADYLAIFSFSFSLSSYSVGIWIIMFSSLGMIHSVINKRQSIPLIPFLFSAWCLAYSYY